MTIRCSGQELSFIKKILWPLMVHFFSSVFHTIRRFPLKFQLSREFRCPKRLSINRNAHSFLWNSRFYHLKQFNYNVWFPKKFETNFHSEIAHYLQNPRLSETKQWIKQRCIFTHKNCHFQFNPKVTQCAVRVFMLPSVKIRKTEKNTRANKYFLIPWEITFSFSNKTNTSGLISQNLLNTFICLNSDTSLSLEWHSCNDCL
mgnify:CR=1 FL=1